MLEINYTMSILSYPFDESLNNILVSIIETTCMLNVSTITNMSQLYNDCYVDLLEYQSDEGEDSFLNLLNSVSFCLFNKNWSKHNYNKEE